MSMSGRAFLRRCMDCRRLILANAVAWAPDFAGGQATYPVICTTCAKARRAAQR